LEGDIKTILGKDPLAKKVQMQVRRFDLRVARAVNLVNRFRDDAERKDANIQKELRSAVLTVLRYAAKTKSVSVAELFKLVDASGDGQVDEDNFVKFLDEADKEVKVQKPKKSGDAKPAAEAKQSEASGEGGESAESKEESAEQAEAAKEAEEEEEEFEVLKLPEFSEEALRRVFPTLLPEGKTSLSEDSFADLMAVRYRVVAKTSLTDTLGFVGATTLCQLEPSDILELEEGPVRDSASGATRIKARVAGTETVGWATVAGNKGTTFLKEGCSKFQVVKETILTEALELDADSESSKLDHQPHKLKLGAIVELLAGPHKEEKSGLVRMKVKSKSEGATGWMTFKSSGGVRFVSVLS